MLTKTIKYAAIFFLIFLINKAFAEATSTPSDPNATPAARAVQTYLAALTNNRLPGVIAGQNTGHSNDIGSTSGLMGFIPLVNELEKQVGEAPGVVGVDYEHNVIATPEQLHKVNAYLIDYWRQGGLVAINWSPHNPWWNDETAIEKKAGVWTDTRSNGGDMSKVDLRDLVNANSPMREIWLRKLNRIADALYELQSAGVVVLWRPLQEMNGNWFWWGSGTAPRRADAYVALWCDMYRYFTEVKGLHNLLWVFSPNQSPSLTEGFMIKPPLSAYPGADYVDIVAGTAYNDQFIIKDYKLYLSTAKPVGIAEFGPVAGGELSRKGLVDTRVYQQQLQNKYPAMAYWMSWSSWSNGDGTQENQALIHNQHVKELLNHSYVITRSRLHWRDFLPHDQMKNTAQ